VTINRKFCACTDDTDTRFRSCSRADRRRIQEHLLNSQLCTVELTPSRTYDEFVRTPAYSIPHLAVAFNSGCSQNDTLSWESTIRMLVAQGTPTVFTVYSMSRLALRVLTRLLRAGVQP
jgi:hypothetical protein